MNDPANMHEYNQRYNDNTRFEGRYAETKTVMPCPACCAPDWLDFPVTAAMNDYQDVTKPTKCKHCNRTFQFKMDRSEAGITMRIYQTDGPPAPEFLKYVFSS